MPPKKTASLAPPLPQPLQGPLHFIGIGGSGMCPLALLAAAKGYSVTGSDERASANTQLLSARGVRVTLGHALSDELLAAAQGVIVSSAIKPENPELRRAQELGRPILHRSDLLAELIATNYAITVAGTHGKTSTTAMIAFLLEALGHDPQAVIGGMLADRSCAAMTGQGSYLVAEADESDGTFLRYRPKVAVITNIAPDHLDYYGDEEGLYTAFVEHVGSVEKAGVAVIGLTSPLSQRLAASVRSGRCLTFGLRKEADFSADQFKIIDGYSLFKLRSPQGSFAARLRAIGEHNIANALAALAALHALGMDLREAVGHLAGYPGVKRRLSLVYASNEFKIVDDYAHNPGKIEAAIAATRQGWLDHRLVVIFQAHRYSRLRTMYDGFMRAFTGCDEVVCLPVYAAGEPEDQHFTQLALAHDIGKASSCPCTPVGSFEEALQVLKEKTHKKTVFLTLGAGDVTNLALELKAALLATR